MSDSNPKHPANGAATAVPKPDTTIPTPSTATITTPTPAPTSTPTPTPAPPPPTTPAKPPTATRDITTTNTFAQAQQRLAARRRAREADAAAHIAAQQSASHLRSRLAASQSPLVRRLGSSAFALWDAISSRDGTRPAFRVGQVDAELLDEELLDLLRGQVGDALRYFNTSPGGGGGGNSRDNPLLHNWDAEISLALRAVLFKLTVWDHDATYGAALQNLKYTDARRSGPALVPPSRGQKAAYGLVTVFGRYLWTKWEDWLVERADDVDSSRAVRRLSRWTSALSTLHTTAALASFLVFLVRGRYRTLLDRLLKMRLAPPTSQVSREVSFEYLNRQLVWHAFTEFLLFLLPLVGINRWRRWLARTWRRTKKIMSSTSAADTTSSGEGQDKKKGELHFLPERTCAICYHDQTNAAATTTDNDLTSAAGAGGPSAATGVVGSAATDVTNPYEAIPCGCVYCFVCLATRVEREEGDGWPCLRCGEVVKECKPWSGDVLEPEEAKSPASKTVAFADEVRAISEAGDDEEEEDDEGDNVEEVERSVVVVEAEDGEESHDEERSPEEMSAQTTSPVGSERGEDDDGERDDLQGSDSDDYEAEEEELGEDLESSG
ncbi:hypothetical protein VTJ49DRAFT_1516 [Mycothermus thermophilus]|uniref:Pex N-terminal domain-containing protein n=1 Tax=Humicola insolens TaxID=85995 RepID=A0ABR3VC37_HUMIN